MLINFFNIYYEIASVLRGLFYIRPFFNNIVVLNNT